jgi:toxin ParE1/3/4
MKSRQSTTTILNKIVILDKAEKDLGEAIQWYSGDIHLAHSFYEEFVAKVGLIEKFPELFAAYGAGYRRALFKRYPYSIIYKVFQDEVQIHAVFHLSRKDDHWHT